MDGTIVVPFSFLWIPPCCPCPVLVNEIRCRNDGSGIQILLASNNHINVDLISVPSFTPTWKYILSCLSDYQYFTPFTCFNQSHELNEIFDYMSKCRTSFWFSFMFLVSMDPVDQAPNVASQQSSSMSSGATVKPNYSCLLHALFDGTANFE